MKRDDSKTLIDAAEEAVAALEQLAEGAVFAPLAERAQETISELHQRAAAAIFPQALEPVDAGTLQDLQSYLPAELRLDFVSGMVALHSIAYPELRAAIRSPRVTRFVVASARVTAVIRAVEEQAAVEADLAVFEQAIAAQLVVKNELQPWSGILAELLPQLRARFSEAKARHELSAAAAVARLQSDQAEADRILADARTARRRDLAERLRDCGNTISFTLPDATNSIPAFTLGTLLLQKGEEFTEVFLDQVERELTLREGMRVSA